MQKGFLANIDGDIKSLCVKILKSSQKDASLETELVKWIAFVDSFPVDHKACFNALNELNGDLVQKSVLLGGGCHPSEADTIVFSAIHSAVVIAITVEDEEDAAKFKDYKHSTSDAAAAPKDQPAAAPPKEKVAQKPVSSPEPKVSKPSFQA